MEEIDRPSLQEGDRVKLLHDVERYPHFIAPAGAEGIITHLDSEMVCVKLDKPLPGAEQWDNEVHWYPSEEDSYGPAELDLERI